MMIVLTLPGSMLHYHIPTTISGLSGLWGMFPAASGEFKLCRSIDPRPLVERWFILQNFPGFFTGIGTIWGNSGTRIRGFYLDRMTFSLLITDSLQRRRTAYTPEGKARVSITVLDRGNCRFSSSMILPSNRSSCNLSFPSSFR